MKIFKFLIIVFSLILMNVSYAMEQFGNLWIAGFYQEHLTYNKKWQGYLYPQLRVRKRDKPLQTLLFETALGYQLGEHISGWFGYRFSEINPGNNSFDENRLFQHLLWSNKFRVKHRLIFRSRLEELERSDFSKTALRYRERFALKYNRFIGNAFVPYFYDEIFFQLNKTAYTPHTFIGQNRLFIGFNYYITQDHLWEIGYMNQYLMPTPVNHQYEMNHILSITYNFFS